MSPHMDVLFRFILYGNRSVVNGIIDIVCWGSRILDFAYL